MYKPPAKSLNELQARQAELINQIVNGSSLSAIAMDKLINALNAVKKQIAEKEKEVADVH